MPPRSFQPDKILEVLVAHQVDFVVIGGLAGLAHGSPFPTRDVDITPDQDRTNLSRLSDALRKLEARIRTDAVPGALPFSHDAESLAAAGVWNLETTFGDLDISMVPNGTTGYEDLVRDAAPAPVVGVVVPIASLADVIRSKEAADRDKDRRVLPVLREILASRYDNP